MFRTVAQLASYIFHPLLLNAVCFCYLVFFPDITLVQHEAQISVLIVGILFILIIPLCNVFLLWLLSKIKSLQMREHKDRMTPFLSTAIIYGIFCNMIHYIYQKGVLHPVFFLVIFSVACSVAMLALLNRFYKISAHALGMGTLTGLYMGIQLIFNQINIPVTVLLFLLSAGVISSRLYLNAHNNKEVYSGFLVGICLNVTLCLLHPFIYLIFEL